MSTGRTVSEILVRICHDLRTPLRSIRSHTELILRDAAATPAVGFEERLGFVVAGAQAAERLVDRLAAYAAALETSSAPSQPIPAGVLVRGASAKLGPSLRDSGIHVNCSELPAVQANPDLLMRVFEELLRNAASHPSAEAPAVAIHATPDSGYWVFRVEDNGPGIDPGDLERIFLPFERLDGSGTGLGLAICRAIVEGHGGAIWAQPAAAGGLQVSFTLPAAADRDDLRDKAAC